MSPYQTLGLSPGASAEEIKRAYRHLASKWHPDRNPNDPTSTAKFAEIQQAYLQLTKGSPSPEPGLSDIFGDAGSMNSVLDGIFNQIFGNARYSSKSKPGTSTRHLDLHLQIDLLFTYFVLGGQLDLNLQGRALQITLPQDLEFGQTIRVPGAGQQSGSRPGDLFLTLNPVFPHDLTVQQRKLLTKFQASFASSSSSRRSTK